MIIKSDNLLLFNPDALKIEYHGGMDYKYYIVAYKDGHRYFVKGYNNQGKAREVLNSLSRVVSVVEI